jgi:hypothetical protein
MSPYQITAPRRLLHIPNQDYALLMHRLAVARAIDGRVFQLQKPRAFAQMINWLARSAELRARVGKAARRPVEDELSASIIGSSGRALYDRLTSPSSSHR